MSVAEMKQIEVGAVVKIGADYLKWLEDQLGKTAWLPSDSSLGVTLLSYGNSTVVALIESGPGFALTHDGVVMGALVVPTNELRVTDDNIQPIEAKVLQRTYVFSEMQKWGGATAAVATLYLMGMNPTQIARKVGVSRQYVHISAERITLQLQRRGYKVTRRH